MEGGVPIGLRDLYYAILDSDPAGGTPVYQTPVKIAGVISATVNPNVTLDSLFAEDGPYESASSMGKIEVELNVADIPLEVQAVLLGHAMDGPILVRKSSDTPPWVAIGYRTIKSNGKYRYMWLCKGRFAPSEQRSETKKDSINFQTATIKGSFVKREADDEWQRVVDEDSIDYIPSIGESWFTSVVGEADTTPPTITTTTPATGTSNVPRNSTVVWNFSEALSLSTVTSSNFFVIEDSDGELVDGTLTINAARTSVTFTPASNLAATTTYKAFVTTNVKDLAGNALEELHVIEFTTAA